MVNLPIMTGMGIILALMHCADLLGKLRHEQTKNNWEISYGFVCNVKGEITDEMEIIKC